MNERDLRAWLAAEAPDAAPNALRQRVARIPVERPSWSRTLVERAGPAWGAIAAAALVVMTVVGINLVARGGIGAPSPAPSSPLSSLAPTPSASALPAYPALQAVGIGRHSVSVSGVPFSFDVPGIGWESHAHYLSRNTVGPQGAEAIIFWTAFPSEIDYVSCNDLLGSSVTASLTDLAGAVAAAPGTDVVTGPSDVTLGGRGAKHVTLFVTYSSVGSNACGPGFFYSWPADDMGAMWTDTIPGDTIRVWIVDVDGTRLFVEAETHWNAGPVVESEIQHIIESIEFE
jgi:hypothetical protein